MPSPRGIEAIGLQLHRDMPNAWDAWDIDEHYRRTVQEIDGVEEIRLESKPEEAAVSCVLFEKRRGSNSGLLWRPDRRRWRSR